jgi:hypothetical protein
MCPPNKKFLVMSKKKNVFVSEGEEMSFRVKNVMTRELFANQFKNYI